MNVRLLKDTFDQQAGKQNSGRLLTTTSHWVRRIFDSSKGQYETADFGEIDTLENLAGLGLVSMKKGSGDVIVAELTRDGKELYMDFMKLGYYL